MLAVIVLYIRACVFRNYFFNKQYYSFSSTHIPKFSKSSISYFNLLVCGFFSLSFLHPVHSNEGGVVELLRRCQVPS